jgi:dipeptidyl aminopeptidase/acylaminoacyl peptidase
LNDWVVSARQTEQLRDALRRNDVRVVTQLYPGLGHADTVAALSIPARHRAPVLDDAVKFISSVTAVAPAEAHSSIASKGAALKRALVPQ